MLYYFILYSQEKKITSKENNLRRRTKVECRLSEQMALSLIISYDICGNEKEGKKIHAHTLLSRVLKRDGNTSK